MEVPKDNEKHVSTKTSAKENKQKMESYNRVDTISIVSLKASVTPIYTKIPWESFLFKMVSELDPMENTIPSLTDYYFNSQTKSIVRIKKKIKHDTLETVSKFSCQAQGDVKEKGQEYFQALGDFFNYNWYHLNELASSYDDSLHKLKVLGF